MREFEDILKELNQMHGDSIVGAAAGVSGLNRQEITKKWKNKVWTPPTFCELKIQVIIIEIVDTGYSSSLNSVVFSQQQQMNSSTRFFSPLQFIPQQNNNNERNTVSALFLGNNNIENGQNPSNSSSTTDITKVSSSPINEFPATSQGGDNIHVDNIPPPPPPPPMGNESNISPPPPPLLPEMGSDVIFLRHPHRQEFRVHLKAAWTTSTSW
ncbi:6710_t:CDS:2 [Ambispora gerdemannii]|uniref:6710_t:CDS:1 n=1 Tax=Ambispora gerdemannii TaxID=144530 RepID=A0A9N9CJF7_9GLOM|nr:6710_t:CDS:2 [Ambispora gerdemannii]